MTINDFQKNPDSKYEARPRRQPSFDIMRRAFINANDPHSLTPTASAGATAPPQRGQA